VLLRVLQEALGNVHRHANANSLSVALERSRDDSTCVHATIAIPSHTPESGESQPEHWGPRPTARSGYLLSFRKRPSRWGGLADNWDRCRNQPGSVVEREFDPAIYGPESSAYSHQTAFMIN
jgi:hypothetical protein